MHKAEELNRLVHDLVYKTHQSRQMGKYLSDRPIVETAKRIIDLVTEFTDEAIENVNNSKEKESV